MSDSNVEHEAPVRDLHGLLLLVFALAAITVPAISIVYLGIYWATLVYVLVAIVWLLRFGCTCMNGGLIYSVLAMPIVFGAGVISVIALVKYIGAS